VPPALVGTWLFFRSRFTVTAVVGMAITAAVTARWVMWVAEVVLDAGHDPRFVPMLEVMPTVYGLCLVVAFRPRLESWERLGGKYLRRHLALAAGLVLLLPQVALLWAGRALPPEASPVPDAGWFWAWMPANVLVITSVALLLATAVGALTAVMVVGITCVAVVALQQLVPAAAAWLPLAGGQDQRPRWLLAAVLAIAAVALWLRGGNVERTARSWG
jgi:hypothetical protein